MLIYDSGYYPVSSYSNSATNNRQPQQQQQQGGASGPQYQNKDTSKNTSNNSGKVRSNKNQNYYLVLMSHLIAINYHTNVVYFRAKTKTQGRANRGRKVSLPKIKMPNPN